MDAFLVPAGENAREARKYADGRENRSITYRYEAGLVLDMVGGENLKIDKEPYSIDFAPDLVKEVWAVAKQLKAKGFRDRTGRAVTDDHLPLNQNRIRAIDLIDFNYPHWHTSRDTVDKCSPASLEQVGKVVTAWLVQHKKRARR